MFNSTSNTFPKLYPRNNQANVGSSVDTLCIGGWSRHESSAVINNITNLYSPLLTEYLLSMEAMNSAIQLVLEEDY